MNMRFFFGVIVLVSIVGCGEQGEHQKVIPLETVPASVMKVASDTMPDVKFEAAAMAKIGGEEVYEIRGKDKRGKIREIEVSPSGKVVGSE